MLEKKTNATYLCRRLCFSSSPHYAMLLTSYSAFFAVYLQGHVYLPSGVCMSGMGRHVSFDQAVAWKVLGEDSSVHCLALCFVNWSFV